MSERIDLIAPGQLVVLRSGSFDMTIDGVDQERQLATCVWFCPASERVQIEQFAVHSLSRVGSEPDTQQREYFSLGEIVQLQSGGPLMTVTTVDDSCGSEPFVGCIWLDPLQRQLTSLYAEFHPAALAKAADFSEEKAALAWVPWDKACDSWKS
ncbi:DUF2158 domain-containing protein [Aeromonas enteropelogenes]|uniref:DUF2158 domain-containing protein n=1 Tax=Aeromonas enteropelogenes TaxID=29489 RepID=UPI00228600D3|nr:DUF2158 domain-containing protein [Aeromonas enteropelogenes]MCZ0750236.1 DUF2158 domain-containing protein [Aeromonas enteropelogenes]